MNGINNLLQSMFIGYLRCEDGRVIGQRYVVILWMMRADNCNDLQVLIFYIPSEDTLKRSISVIIIHEAVGKDKEGGGNWQRKHVLTITRN